MTDYRRQLEQIFDNNKAFYYDDLTSYSCPTIRLLYVKSGAFGDPIDCQLRTEVLKPGLTFDALSYAWGDTLAPQSITLGNKAGFRITESLFGALRRLRTFRAEPLEEESPIIHTDEFKLTRVEGLWIDAICINQANIMERSSQVAMMATIYKSARVVFIWLGTCGRMKPTVEESEDCAFHDACNGWVELIRLEGGAREPLCEARDLTKSYWWWRTWVSNFEMPIIWI